MLEREFQSDTRDYVASEIAAVPQSVGQKGRAAAFIVKEEKIDCNDVAREFDVFDVAAGSFQKFAKALDRCAVCRMSENKLQRFRSPDRPQNPGPEGRPLGRRRSFSRSIFPNAINVRAYLGDICTDKACRL